MKVKPYRLCDICGKAYVKTHGIMKVKRFYDPFGICDMYNEPKIMYRMDICPKCGELMLTWIKEQRKGADDE